MTEKPFMIKSNVLEKLRPSINKAVSLITQAIEAKRPVWIRHHADTDGYCAGVALERAILPLIYKRHTRERDMFYHYSRLPCKTPYYDYGDATRDLTNFLNNMSKFETKTPLIIICDTGSSEQDIMAVKKVRIYGAKVVVIDHHPVFSEITENVDAHINPHLVGNVYDFSAGMLCAEIAKQLAHETDDLEFLAAVAGIGDKVASRELEEYIELCKKQGYSLEVIKETAECLDFEAFTLGFIDSRTLVDDFLGADKTKQEKLLELIKPEINKLRRIQLETNKKYMKIEEKKDKIICRLEVNKVRNFGNYPSHGKTVGIIHDYLMKEKNKPVISFGISDEQVTFRCSKEIEEFDVNKIIRILKEKFPYAQIEGGGHRVAGSIGFISAAKEEILEFLDEYVEKLK